MCVKIFMIVAFYLHKIVKNYFELLRVKRIGWPGFESGRRQNKLDLLAKPEGPRIHCDL